MLSGCRQPVYSSAALQETIYYFLGGHLLTKNLTVGKPMRLLLSFIIPTLLGLLFQQMYNMVDTMIVGRLLGADALAAVGATGSINFLVIGFCVGVCNGFAIPVAREMGAGEMSRMRSIVMNAAYLSGIFALLLTAATGFACRAILKAMATPEDIFENAYVYIFIIFMGIPTTFLYNLLAGIIRSLGDSRTPVYFLALSSLLNVVLDVVLILYADMGVAGAAAATVVSQAVSGFACLWVVRKKFSILRTSVQERRFDRKLCMDLCAMGLPMGFQYSVTAIGSIILQHAVNQLGSLYVAAVAAGTKLNGFLACPFDAMGAAMATYCGQNIGAGKVERLSRGIRDCTMLGLVYSLAALAAMMAFAPDCAALFIDSSHGEEADTLIPLVSRYVIMSTAFFFPLALVNILRFSIQGMGFSVLAILAGVLEMIARTVIGSVFVPLWGFNAVVFASPAAWVCADLFLIPACVLCIHRMRQKQKAKLTACAVSGEYVHHRVISAGRWYVDQTHVEQIHRHRQRQGERRIPVQRAS